MDIKYIISYRTYFEKEEEIDLETFVNDYLFNIIINALEKRIFPCLSQNKKEYEYENKYKSKIIMIWILSFVYINKNIFKNFMTDIIRAFEYEKLSKDKIAKIVYILRIKLRNKILELTDEIISNMDTVAYICGNIYNERLERKTEKKINNKPKLKLVKKKERIEDGNS